MGNLQYFNTRHFCPTLRNCSAHLWVWYVPILGNQLWVVVDDNGTYSICNFGKDPQLEGRVVAKEKQFDKSLKQWLQQEPSMW